SFPQENEKNNRVPLISVKLISGTLRACSKSGILAFATPKFYLAGSKRARISGFLRSVDCKNPQFEQALRKH
ncbi:MAG: hypothetical protein LBD48_10225, partial [Treponema sp.]|nr:hypothetical protein [Treponema sp.]